MNKFMRYICIFVITICASQYRSLAIESELNTQSIQDIKVVTSSNYSLEDAQNIFFEYHIDLSNFEKAITELNGILDYDPDNVEVLIFLSRVWLTYGHYIDGDTPEKWERFQKGSEAAEKAIDLSPSNPNSYFYYAVNEASLAKSKGKFSSLFLISKIKSRLDKALELDPNHIEAIAMKGAILSSIPGLLGGDVKESEKLIREALNMDPHLTSTKIFLAKNLVKQKNYDQAKEILEEILNEKYPTVEADWHLNKRVAQKMIEKINGIRENQS